MFRLRFAPSQLKALAARFPALADDPVLAIAGRARARGYLTKREFMALGDWKTPRSRPRRAGNTAAVVHEATRLALGATSVELKIGILRTLEGVEWPTASVILHLCDRAPFPILDVRALWSAGLHGTPRYTTALWVEYVTFTRGLARRARVSMRDVDRALWQYSKENQR
ncbi:MAG TPA: hypothetical protein VFV19_12350 [Candidatus Polarisedimenticolaceae bacterium]|nr:hypothetical protein [Candidatus Polarisedimenticolaceae bacterium]